MARAFKYFCVLFVAFVAFVLVDSQSTSFSISRSRSRSSRQSQTTTTTQRPNRTHPYGHRIGQRTHHNRTKTVLFQDRDKYYENGSDEYEYEDYEDENTTSRSREEDENKFIEGSTGIVLDHVEFVLLRLKTILKATSSNLTDILKKQKEEFKVNTSYREGWEAAVHEYRKSKKAKILKNAKTNSIVQKVPEEYHIALLAYTLGDPAMYAEFNRDTRNVCSGTDVDNYQWKSFFKLLHLAVQTLGANDKYRDNRRFLYRGATLDYNLKEGQAIAFQHFVSTSATLNVAEEFADKKTLFEFQGLYNGTAMNIQDFSYYEHEKETLFSPIQTFQVDSIHVGKHYTRYVLVNHVVPPLCDFDKSDDSGDESPEKIDVKDNSLKYSAGGSVILQEKYVLLIALVFAFIPYLKMQP